MRHFLPSSVLRLWIFLALTGVVGAQGVATRALPEVVDEARAHYAARSFALALPLFAEWRERAPEGSLEALEAGAFQLACLRLVRMENRNWDAAEEEFFATSAEAIRQRAEALRELGEPAVEAWRRVLEAAALDLSITLDGWDPLQRLLDYWARSTDLKMARAEYLRLLWAASDEGRALYRLSAPERLSAVRAATRIADSPENVARFNLLLAKLYERDSLPDAIMRRGDALERAVAAGPKTSAFAESLLELGEWAERFGIAHYDENGEQVFQPDYVRAAQAYTRLLETTGEAQQAWQVRARHALDRLRRPDLQVLVGHGFRPETEVQFAVRWRNLEAPLVEVYPLSVTREGLLEALRSPQPPAREAEAELTFQSQLAREPERAHYSVMEPVRLERSLPPAAYAVVVRSGDEVAWAPLVVTNLVLVSHRTDDEMVVWAVDAGNGKPRSGINLAAELEVTKPGRGNETETHRLTGTSDEQGLWVFSWPRHGRGRLAWVLAAQAPEDHGATLLRGRSWSRGADALRREAYLMTDRSLYRPGDSVRVSGWLRERAPESAWQLPDDPGSLGYRLVSWGGGEIATGTLELNAYGSFALELPLPETAPLGPYRLEIQSSRKDVHWDFPNNLFNVEEYRTPEIQAVVEITSERPLLPGDPIEGSVQVDYYSGGAVEDAEVELVVSRQAFLPPLFPLGESVWARPAGPGRMVRSEPEVRTRLELTTDARGRASFAVPTDRDLEGDWTYRVEARVRDLSRRETSAETKIPVTQQAYFASLDLPHRLVAPGDEVRLAVRLEDAAGDPVADDGVVRLLRERWREIYVHRRRGTEISGAEYRELPDRSMLSVAQSDYRLRDSGFVTEEIARFDVVVTRDGRAELTYAPEAVGYYTFEWVSRGERGKPVTAEAPLWVSDDATEEIGFRPGGVRLIADPGPFALGEPIPVLVTAPVRNRWVLLSVSGRGMLSHRIVRLEGTSRLIHLNPQASFQPNIFLDASLVSEESHYVGTLELEVPHAEQFLEVSVEPDGDGYEPGDEARVTIRVRDAAGDPVSTQLTFAASDAALYALLPERREPVREAFFGQRNPHALGVSSSLENAPFFQPLEVDQAPTDASLAEETIEMSPFSVDSGSDVGYAARSTLSGALLADVEGGGPAEALFVPALRADFRSTLHWAPLVQTDDRGEAQVRFAFPDNLTAWRLQAVAVGPDTRVGEARVRTTTRLPVITRLQLPRFLTERDTATLSGVVQNNTLDPVVLNPALGMTGPVTLLSQPTATLSVPGESTVRADWQVRAEAPGVARFRMRAASVEMGDAVERALAIVPHGLSRTIGRIGRAGADGAVALALDLPSDRDRTTVSVRLATSLAPELFAALPYLIDYPYGCTEQTLSRFLPALLVRRAARLLGQPLDQLDARVYADLDPAAWGDREDLRAVLDAVLADGLDRLREMQKIDGSWPWMPGGASDPYMTAYAVWCLSHASEIGIDVAGLRLEEARAWLERALIEQELAPAESAWVLLALSSRYRSEGFGRPSRMEARVFLDLMNRRDALSPMSLAMLALSARYYGFDEDTRVLLDNLANSIQRSDGVLPGIVDAEGEPLSLPEAHWGQRNGYVAWSEGAVESTAWVLSALLAIEPEHPWVLPTVNWLSRNRTGTHWENTRATAFTLLALTKYLSHSPVASDAATFAIEANGQPVPPPGGAEAWTLEPWMPLVASVPTELLGDDETRLTVRRLDRAAPFFFGVHAEFYDRSEDILAGSSEIAIQREYWHLKPVDTLLEGVREVMTPLANGDAIASGDRVEVVLRIEAPRDLRYVLLEDLKLAGLEAVQVLSGPAAVARELAAQSPPGPRPAYGPRTLRGFQELRDREVAFLFDRLPAGTWEVRYRLRAEAPGVFHGLPATVAPMYLPHVFGNSSEWRLEVRDDTDE